MRRVGAGVDGGFSGISFVIVVEIRLLEGFGYARLTGRRN
jgi:hypothetical protein